MGVEAKITFSGDASSAVAAANKAGEAYKRLTREINDLQSIASKALALGGLSVSAAEVIKMADNYGQLTARLQLATRFTGDFAAVQAGLRQTADDTRASLTATIDMYSKMSPVLQALGKNGVQSIGIVATVNKAIALSGVGAEQAAAGVMQFTQALGSGRLNGEELNSILENTPGLADAIAQGLGVARGALKKMGEEGKLTSDVIITALEKVAPRVAADFEKLPLSVGQAFTKMGNDLTAIVGGGAQATGAMAALARAIVIVSEGFKAFAASIQLKGFFEIIAETIDGFSRVMRIGGRYIGAWAADMAGGMKNSRAIWQAFYDDVESISNEAWQHQRASLEGQSATIEAGAKELAERRLELETQPQEKIKALGVLREVQEGRVSADILVTDAARTAEQIKNAEKLRDALSAAWKQSLTDAQAAGEAAKNLFAQAADVRQTGADKAAAKQRSKLSPEEQQAQIKSEFENAASAASQAAGLAVIATLHGRLENAAKLTEQAKKDAERAARFADQIEDPQAGSEAINKAADIQARLLEAQAKAKQGEQKSLEERAASQAELINGLDKQITELQTKAAAIKVAADVSAAESAIAGLQAQLNALKDRTVTVTVNTVNSSSSSDKPLPGLASGGYTGPGSKWKPAGIVHAGEYVLRQEVVRQPGALAFLSRFNAVGLEALKRNGYAAGGLVRNLTMPSLSPRTAPSSAASGTPITLVLDNHQVPVTATQDVANELKTLFAREALKKGGRR